MLSITERPGDGQWHMRVAQHRSITCAAASIQHFQHRSITCAAASLQNSQHRAPQRRVVAHTEAVSATCGCILAAAGIHPWMAAQKVCQTAGARCARPQAQGVPDRRHKAATSARPQAQGRPLLDGGCMLGANGLHGSVRQSTMQGNYLT